MASGILAPNPTLCVDFMFMFSSGDQVGYYFGFNSDHDWNSCNDRLDKTEPLWILTK